MAKSKKKVIPKKRGRPATGKDPMMALRMSPNIRAEIEAWASRQDDKPSRSEAVRRLVEIALKAAKP
jgi:hypothetical protein